MRKYLVHPDGRQEEISPITFAEFMAIDQWAGDSERGWDSFLAENGYIEPSQYREEYLRTCSMRFEFLAPTQLELNFGASNEEGETNYQPMETMTTTSEHMHRVIKEWKRD